MNRVQQVVDWIIEEGMYCLLNTHHDGGTEGWVEASYRAFEKYEFVYSKWYTNIAERCKDYPEKLILCGTNEMISAKNQWGNGDAEAIDTVNKWNQLFVNSVRSTGGNNASRNLLVGTYVCSTEKSDLINFIKPKDNEDKCWRWAYDQYKKKKDRLVFKETAKSPLLNERGEQAKWNVYTKRYRFEAEEKGNVPSNIIDDCINSLGTNRLTTLGLDFSFAKPCELIQKLVSITNKSKDIIIMDFFAGSGTTMDAIIQMNDNDGGKRQTILVQYPEETFEIKNGIEKPFKGCESLYKQGIKNLTRAAWERNKRVISGYNGYTTVTTNLYKVKVTLNLLKKGNDVIENLKKLKEKESENDVTPKSWTLN